MRGPRERAAWTALAVLALAGAAAAWWTSAQWLPHAGPWAEQAWRRATRPGPETLPAHKRGAGAGAPASAASALQLRKCVQADGRVAYADQACPVGSREMVVEGAVTSLPGR